MKKILIVIQVIIVGLVIAKFASMAGLIKKAESLPEASLIVSQALANSATPGQNPAPPSAPTAAVPAKKTSDDGMSKKRDLAAALLAKKNELDKRENHLRNEEQRLIALRKEITDKIEYLKNQEEKLSSVIEAVQNSETKKYKDMAKVYEAAPAAKAGSMLEKLDIKTAAGITVNMKKDKAGAVWGYISPQRAVEITKEITRTSRPKAD